MPVGYTDIVGKFTRAVVDGPDSDRDPDRIPIEGLQFEFVVDLKPAIARDTVAKETVYLDPIPATTDENGILIGPDGLPGIRLTASDSPDLEPNGWTYTVTTKGAGLPTVKTTFVTESGKTLDFSEIIAVPPNPGNQIPAWTAVVSQATTAAAEATEAKAEAVAAAESVQRDQPGGVAPLDGSKKIPEPNLPERLTAAGLSATIGEQIDEALEGFAPGSPLPVENFVRALDMRDPAPLTIAIASDSTADSASEWFETAWREILRDRWPERPAQVYRFSNTTNSYPAVIPIQAGDSSLGMLTIYNASYAGGTLSTQRTYFSAMFPVRPDLLFINHGHNYTVEATDFLADIDAFVGTDMAAFAPFSVVLFSQNPEFAQGGVTSGQVAQHARRQRALRDHANVRGWGYIPSFEAFSQRGDGGLSLMQASDGKHPTLAVLNPTVETGARVQAEAAKRYLASQSRRNVVRVQPDLIVNGYDHLYHAEKIAAAGAEPAVGAVVHTWWDQAPASELMSDAASTTGGAVVTEESGVRFLRIDTPPAAALGTAWADTSKPRTMVYLVRMPQLTVNYLQSVGYRIRRITGGNWELSNGTDTITVAGDSDWSIVVAVLDGANSKINVEGVETAAATAFAPGAIVTTGITIGTGSATDYSPLDLRMVLSYPRALTSAEIATLRAQIRAKNPTLGLAA